MKRARRKAYRRALSISVVLKEKMRGKTRGGKNNPDLSNENLKELDSPEMLLTII